MRHKEFIAAYSRKMNVKESTAEKYIEGMIEIMCAEFDKPESVTIKHLGRFYCDYPKYGSSETKVFKFTPAKKIKDILGWGRK